MTGRGTKVTHGGADDSIRPGEQTVRALGRHGVDETLIARILKSESCAGQRIELQLPPAAYMEYVDLQSAIAAYVPREPNRPTIELRLKGARAEERPSLGIIGGTGPLSDAAMLEKTMARLKAADADFDRLHVRLLSAPPPRNLSDALQAGAPYARSLENFFDGAECHSVVLASNTAHGNIDIVRALARLTSLRGLLGHGRVRDLVDQVVSYVRADVPAGRESSLPMILGTAAAFESGLYPNRFGDLAALVVDRADDDDTRPEKAQLLQVTGLNHLNLQAFIDHAKQNGFDTEVADALAELISAEIARHDPRPTHVILACTELPLALGEERIAELAKNSGARMIDTEEFFADRYAEYIADRTEGLSRENLHLHYPCKLTRN